LFIGRQVGPGLAGEALVAVQCAAERVEQGMDLLVAETFACTSSLFPTFAC